MLDGIGLGVQYRYGRRMGMSQGTGINQPLLADSLIGCLVGMTDADISNRVVSQQLPDYSAIVAVGYCEALTILKRDNNLARIEVYPDFFSSGSKTVNVLIHIACNRVARQMSFSKGGDAIFTSHVATMDDNLGTMGNKHLEGTLQPAGLAVGIGNNPYLHLQTSFNADLYSLLGTFTIIYHQLNPCEILLGVVISPDSSGMKRCDLIIPARKG